MLEVWIVFAYYKTIEPGCICLKQSISCEHQKYRLVDCCTCRFADGEIADDTQHTVIGKALLAAHYQLYGKVEVKKAASMTGLVLL
jgi:hypothetical protein